MDRIGDTFRWKGENVSCNEVAAVLSGCEGVTEVSVLGVQTPGYFVFACMAALVATPSFSLQEFAQHALNNLPIYAQPLFIRLLPQIPVTSTFKHQKVLHRKEGINPTKVSDPLYMLDRATKTYTPFSPEKYAMLSAGRSTL
jgi:acyl-CoA synthetase (AMP-forming)/AMP-acid ligase II